MDVSDASATWTMVTGWLTSPEGGIRWAKKIAFFIVILMVSWILANVLGKGIQKAVVRVHGASELLKDFIVKITRKIVFINGFVVRPWVATENYWDVYWDVTHTVKERFDAEGVSIPFPQRDVHLHNVATT